MNTEKRKLIESFKGGLIVSCQVQHDDPTFSVDFVVKMAKAAKWGGAVGIRANSPDQIEAIKKEVDLPIIGLYKIWHDDTDVFITPTLEAAEQVWDAGAEIIALDCTEQITHEGRPAYELLPIVKKAIPEAIASGHLAEDEWHNRQKYSGTRCRLYRSHYQAVFPNDLAGFCEDLLFHYPII